MEKLLEEDKFLEIYLRISQIKTLHAKYAKKLGHAEENCWYCNMQNMSRLHLHAAIVFDKLPHAIK